MLFKNYMLTQKPSCLQLALILNLKKDEDTGKKVSLIKAPREREGMNLDFAEIFIGNLSFSIKKNTR